MSKDAYIEFCREKKPAVPLFMQPWWLDTVCAGWDVVLARKGDTISGAWPYPAEQKMGVTLLRNPMLTPYLGPAVFFPPDLKEANIDNFEHETIDALISQLPAAKVWRLAIRPGIRQAGIFNHHGLQVTARQTFLLNLAPGEDVLLSNIKDTARRNIRSAEAEITIVNDATLVGELYRYQHNTLTNKGRHVPYPLSYVQQLLDGCLANGAAAVYAAKKDGVVQAIVWIVWDDTCSYYFMGGQNPDSGNYKAMTALLWHAIRQSRAIGRKWFDFEGSMDPGVERFFRYFGGRRELYLVLSRNDSPLWKLKELLRG